MLRSLSESSLPRLQTNHHHDAPRNLRPNLIRVVGNQAEALSDKQISTFYRIAHAHGVSMDDSIRICELFGQFMRNQAERAKYKNICNSLFFKFSERLIEFNECPPHQRNEAMTRLAKTFDVLIYIAIAIDPIKIQPAIYNIEKHLSLSELVHFCAILSSKSAFGNASTIYPLILKQAHSSLTSSWRHHAESTIIDFNEGFFSSVEPALNYLIEVCAAKDSGEDLWVIEQFFEDLRHCLQDGTQSALDSRALLAFLLRFDKNRLSSDPDCPNLKCLFYSCIKRWNETFKCRFDTPYLRQKYAGELFSFIKAIKSDRFLWTYSELKETSGLAAFYLLKILIPEACSYAVERGLSTEKLKRAESIDLATTSIDQRIWDEGAPASEAFSCISDIFKLSSKD